MLNSLQAALSGIETSQTQMDLIGNNIANVNTVGFKSGSATFVDLLSQLISGASAPTGQNGGINPMQVGLGVALGSITNNFAEGNLQNTGINTDLAIQGNGFFILGQGTNLRYTRAGSFTLDGKGNLVDPSSGLIVQGWQANATGSINTNGPMTNLSIPSGQTVPAEGTSAVTYAQNVDASVDGTLVYQPTPMTITSGASGDQAQVTVALTPTANFNEYSYVVSAIGINGATVTGVAGGTGVMALDASGTVVSNTGGAITVSFQGGSTITVTPPAFSGAQGGAFTVTSVGDSQSAPLAGAFTAAQNSISQISVYDTLGGAHTLQMTISKAGNNQWTWQASSPNPGVVVTGSGLLNFDPSTGTLLTSSGGPIQMSLGAGLGSLSMSPDFSSVTQYASGGTLIAQSQDGHTSGSLQSYSFDTNGTVTGVFTNGVTQKLAQLALATFSNPGGLIKQGNSQFSVSENSGQAVAGVANTGGRGSILASTLESSNVDLTKEFTSLIQSQRSFEADAKVITASDEILQTLINMKR